MRQGRRQRWVYLWVRLVAVGILCAAGRDGSAQSPSATTAVSPWATGGVSGTASAGSNGTGSLPYWQAPALPAAVIQGGTIPTGWTPQAVPYQGIGPDGRAMTMYYSPTYVFTYTIGPPVPASATIPSTSRVNRRQANPQWQQQQVPMQYPAQGAPVAAPMPPPATVARYPTMPYQYPPGSQALNGTPIVPPAGMPPAPALATASPAMIQPPPNQWGAGQQAAPPVGQWAPSAEAPPMSPNPDGQAFAAAAPPMVAGTAGAIAAASQPQAAAPSPISSFSSPSSTPAQPVSVAPQLPSASRSAAPHLWRVVGVHDGDTLTCLDESNQQQKVRLAEIDAPEIGQGNGKASREALADMVFGKTVEVTEDGKDRYGRWIGHLSVNGIDVNRQMIATGNAWHYEDYSRDPSLAAIQSQAQSQQLGLWAQPNPVAPWDFRKSGQQ